VHSQAVDPEHRGALHVRPTGEERLHKLWLFASLGATLAAGGIVLITPQGWGVWPLIGFAPGLACLPFSTRHFLRWRGTSGKGNPGGTLGRPGNRHRLTAIAITALLALPLLLVALLTFAAREAVVLRFFGLLAILLVPAAWIVVRLLFMVWRAGHATNSPVNGA
jgi:hypothetical protein